MENPRNSQALEAYTQESVSEVPDERVITSNFERMRTHFNCLAEIEKTHGSLIDSDRLREVLKQNTFQLGLESNKNKNIQMELTMLKRS